LLDTGKSAKTNGGISLLKGEQLEKAENLLDLLDRYGLFVLRHGEVEHWLPGLDVKRNEKWLHQIFAALGSDPKLPDYVRPGKDDVWAFLDKISIWLKDKNRRGIHYPAAATGSAITEGAIGCRQPASTSSRPSRCRELLLHRVAMSFVAHGLDLREVGSTMRCA
jgi:hypothetical protein